MVSWAVFWVAAGAICLAGLLYSLAAVPLLLAVSIAGTLAMITWSGVQLVGFSVLATSLALFDLLFKLSIAGSAIALGYYIKTGKLPTFPGSEARSEEPADQPLPIDPALADWDARFEQTSAKRRVHFQELSPTSSFKLLREFIAQEGLPIKTGGRSKADVYKDIAVQLVQQ